MAHFANSFFRILPGFLLFSAACTGPRSSGQQRSEPSGAPAAATQSDGTVDRAGAQKPSDTATQAPSKEASAHAVEHKKERANGEGTQDSQQQLTATKTGPSVKRLVMASDVKEREPIELGQAKSKQPIVAFLELSNATGADASVIITFEHENGKKVGFIELSVPGESPRYRTWGRTRHIDESGTWTAVVRTKAGDELARRSFSVTG